MRELECEKHSELKWNCLKMRISSGKLNRWHIISVLVSTTLFTSTGYSYPVEGPWLNYSESKSVSAGSSVWGTNDSYPIYLEECLTRGGVVNCSGGDEVYGSSWTDESGTWRLEIKPHSTMKVRKHDNYSENNWRTLTTGPYNSAFRLWRSQWYFTAYYNNGYNKLDVILTVDVDYRWVQLKSGGEPVGRVYISSGTGLISGGYARLNLSGDNPDVPPPVPADSCTVNEKDLNLTHGTIAVNKPSTTKEQTVTITCTNKKYPAITINGVQVQRGLMTVPVADNDKVLSTLNTHMMITPEGDEGVTSVNISSSVTLKQAGKYEQAVPLIFTIP
ncbi:hypothetical protein ABO03_003376 [Salmonella enterica subsp. enterica serovar Glostrup]|nr:hypothetical protein [Salmonella enterica subsp. enterica serovar Glostrup]